MAKGKKNQKESFNSTKNFRSVMEFGMGIFQDDKDFTIISVDDDFCRMLGYKRNELMEHCWGKFGELIYKKDYDKVIEHMSRQWEAGDTYSCEYRLCKKDGTALWVLDSGLRDVDENGNAILKSVIINNNNIVTLRKERDAAYENIPGGVAYVDINEDDFIIRDGNDNFFEMLNVEKKQYLIENIRYTDEEDLPKLREHLCTQAKRKEPVDIEFRARFPKENKTKWYRLIGRYYAQELDCAEYLCIMTDVTERRETLAQLAQEKERYRIAMKCTADVVYEYNPLKDEMMLYRGNTENSSRIAIERGIYPNWREVLFEQNVIHPDDRDKVMELLNVKGSSTTEIRVLSNNPSNQTTEYQWYKVRATETRDSDDKAARVLGVLQNIEQQREMMAVSEELKPIFDLQLSKYYDRIFKVDLLTEEYKIFSNEGEGFYNFEKVGNHANQVRIMADGFVYKEDKERYIYCLSIERMKELLNTGEATVTKYFRVLSPDGEYRWKCYRYSYFGVDMDTILVNVQDVHDVRMEEQKTEAANRRILINALEEAKKASEVRKNFVSMMTKEVRAPLQAISECSKMSDEDISDTQIVRENLDAISDAASYMLKIMNDLTELGQLSKGKLHIGHEAMNLESLIMGMVEEQKEVAAQNQIELHTIVRISPNRVYYGDSFRVRQVVGNVLANCVRFSPTGETVNISVTERDERANFAKIVISIVDMGVHVNEDYFERIYWEDGESIFAREGGVTENTGFSLVLCKEITELLGGKVSVTYGNRGENHFDIEIPLEYQENVKAENIRVKQIPPEEPVATVDLGRYSLLLVQSATERGRLLSPLLKINGARVELANSAREALSIWNTYTEGSFDAILVDSVLPDTDYGEFAAMIRKSKHFDAKRIPIIVMSDNVAVEDMKRGYQKGINGSINKPIDMHRLLQLLQVFNGGLI